jgi:hypothetical protein
MANEEVCCVDTGALRSDYDVACLRSLARRAKDGPQTRRLLALVAIYDGNPAPRPLGSALSKPSVQSGVELPAILYSVTGLATLTGTLTSLQRRPEKTRSEFST